MNREQWLTNVATELVPIITQTGNTVPEFDVTVSFPSKRGLSSKKKRIGECWSPHTSKSGRYQILISPIIDSAMEVAATIAHELIHATVGIEHGHKGPFVQLVRTIGLLGKPTATTPGPEFISKLSPILDKIGQYPHSALTPARMNIQATRLLKHFCPSCRYTVRITQKWLDISSLTCPMCNVEFVTTT
jgi:hypothetical protein